METKIETFKVKTSKLPISAARWNMQKVLQEYDKICTDIEKGVIMPSVQSNVFRKIKNKPEFTTCFKLKKATKQGIYHVLSDETGEWKVSIEMTNLLNRKIYNSSSLYYYV